MLPVPGYVDAPRDKMEGRRYISTDNNFSMVSKMAITEKNLKNRHPTPTL